MQPNKCRQVPVCVPFLPGGRKRSVRKVVHPTVRHNNTSLMAMSSTKEAAAAGHQDALQHAVREFSTADMKLKLAESVLKANRDATRTKAKEAQRRLEAAVHELLPNDGDGKESARADTLVIPVPVASLSCDAQRHPTVTLARQKVCDNEDVCVFVRRKQQRKTRPITRQSLMECVMDLAANCGALHDELIKAAGNAATRLRARQRRKQQQQQQQQEDEPDKSQQPKPPLRRRRTTPAPSVSDVVACAMFDLIKQWHAESLWVVSVDPSAPARQRTPKKKKEEKENNDDTDEPYPPPNPTAVQRTELAASVSALLEARVNLQRLGTMRRDAHAKYAAQKASVTPLLLQQLAALQERHETVKVHVRDKDSGELQEMMMVLRNNNNTTTKPGRDSADNDSTTKPTQDPKTPTLQNLETSLQHTCPLQRQPAAAAASADDDVSNRSSSSSSSSQQHNASNEMQVFNKRAFCAQGAAYLRAHLSDAQQIQSWLLDAHEKALLQQRSATESKKRARNKDNEVGIFLRRVSARGQV